MANDIAEGIFEQLKLDQQQQQSPVAPPASAPPTTSVNPVAESIFDQLRSEQQQTQVREPIQVDTERFTGVGAGLKEAGLAFFNPVPGLGRITERFFPSPVDVSPAPTSFGSKTSQVAAGLVRGVGEAIGTVATGGLAGAGTAALIGATAVLGGTQVALERAQNRNIEAIRSGDEREFGAFLGDVTEAVSTPAGAAQVALGAIGGGAGFGLGTYFSAIRTAAIKSGAGAASAIAKEVAKNLGVDVTDAFVQTAANVAERIDPTEDPEAFFDALFSAENLRGTALQGTLAALVGSAFDIPQARGQAAAARGGRTDAIETIGQPQAGEVRGEVETPAPAPRPEGEAGPPLVAKITRLEDQPVKTPDIDPEIIGTKKSVVSQEENIPKAPPDVLVGEPVKISSDDTDFTITRTEDGGALVEVFDAKAGLVRINQKFESFESARLSANKALKTAGSEQEFRPVAEITVKPVEEVEIPAVITPETPSIVKTQQQSKAPDATPSQKAEIRLKSPNQALRAAENISRGPLKSEVRSAISKGALGRGRLPAVITNDREALRWGLQRQQTVSAKAALSAAKDVVATHQELVRFAQEKLNSSDLGTLSQAIVTARTPAQIRRVVAAIQLVERKSKTNSALNDLKIAIGDSRKEGLRPEFKKLSKVVTGEITSNTTLKSVRANIKRLLRGADKDSLPQELAARIESTFAKTADADNLGDLEPGMIREIASAIRSITKQNQLKESIIIGGKKRNREKVISTATDQIETRNAKRIAKKGLTADARREPTGTKGLVKRLFLDDQASQETKSEAIGGRDQLTQDVTFNNLQRGNRGMLDIEFEAVDVLRELGMTGKEFDTIVRAKKRSVFPSRRKDNTIETPFPAATFKNSGKRVGSLRMTSGERIDFYNNLKDSRSRREILKNKGGGITLKDSVLSPDPIKIKEADIAAFLSSLTPREKEIGDAIFDWVNGPGKEIVNESWVRIHGSEIAFRDDYWMRMRDNTLEATDPEKAFNDWRTNMLDSYSAFKPRSGSQKPILIGDGLIKYFNYMQRIAAFSAKHESSLEAIRFLDDPKIKSAFQKQGRGDWLRDMKETIIADRGLGGRMPSTINTIMSSMIRRAQKGILAFRPHVNAFQLVSSMTASNEMGRIVTPVLGGSKKAKILAEMVEHSSVLRARLEGGAQAILTPGMNGNTAREFFTGESQSEFGLGGIRRMDASTIAGIWESAKKQAREEGDPSLDNVARITERVVGRTQPTWDLLTNSSIARDAKNNALLKAMVMFTSQRNKNFNMALRSIDEFSVSDKSTSDLSKMIAGVGVPLVVSQILIEGIRRAAFFAYSGFQDTESDEEFVDRATGMAWSFLRSSLSNWLIGGDAIGIIGDNIVGDITGDFGLQRRELETPLKGAFNNTVRVANNMANVVEKIIKDENIDASDFTKSIAPALNALATTTGLPVSGPSLVLRKLNRGLNKPDRRIPE